MRAIGKMEFAISACSQSGDGADNSPANEYLTRMQVTLDELENQIRQDAPDRMLNSHKLSRYKWDWTKQKRYRGLLPTASDERVNADPAAMGEPVAAYGATMFADVGRVMTGASASTGVAPPPPSYDDACAGLPSYRDACASLQAVQDVAVKVPRQSIPVDA